MQRPLRARQSNRSSRGTRCERRRTDSACGQRTQRTDERSCLGVSMSTHHSGDRVHVHHVLPVEHCVGQVVRSLVVSSLRKVHVLNLAPVVLAVDLQSVSFAAARQ